jgi:myo-inositol-1(or 4)-monophosphatase
MEKTMNNETYLEVASIAARKAGLMLKKNIDVSREISYKGAVDLVTNFDRQAQETIVFFLSNKFPDHDFLAEEDLERFKGVEHRWIIDPIDGTTNYAHSFPIFSVSIALEWKKDVVLGVVYDPMRDELFSAIKGNGAHLNGKKIRVSFVDELDKSLLATGFPYDLRESQDNNINHFNNFLIRAQGIRRGGSAALDLCYVACGRFDGFWELKLKPWDVAAGALIVKESEGQLSDFRNKKVSIFGTEIVASNSLIHDEIIDVLRQGMMEESK